MKTVLRIGLAMIFLTVAPLWAADDQPSQNQHTSPGYGYGTGDMGPGMMGPGSGYYGRGPGMMRYDRGMGHGMRGRGHMMGPDGQAWHDMPPEMQEQYRQMRSQFMQETLSLRQELGAKQMELETLWDQQDPDPEKVKALSKRIAEIRSQLDQKHDDYLMQCRQAFGDLGWSCPGGGWRNY
jgi:hypothetical protein